MAKSMIKQHEPLRVPGNWDGQARQFVVQVESILDDLYSKFSRITIKDMQPELASMIKVSTDGMTTFIAWKEETAEYLKTVATKQDLNGKMDKSSTYQSPEDILNKVESYVDDSLTDFSNTIQTAAMIAQYVGNNAYKLKSGITITSEGIDISASKYVKIASGGYFQVRTGAFGIQTNATDYVIWAGALTPTANTPFWLKKSGDLHANTIYGGQVYYDTLIGPSSREVKRNIQPLDDHYGVVLDSLSPVSFIYDKDSDERHTRFGLIWEDAVQTLPEICMERDGEKGINYLDLVPLMLREIQLLRGRVKELEASNDH